MFSDLKIARLSHRRSLVAIAVSCSITVATPAASTTDSVVTTSETRSGATPTSDSDAAASQVPSWEDLYSMRASALSREVRFALLNRIHEKPLEEDDRLIDWLVANANDVEPAFLYELAHRFFANGKHAAMVWYVIGLIRARCDAFRCVDETAIQGIRYLPRLARQTVVFAHEHHAEFREASLEALARPHLFGSTVSPYWIGSHGIKTWNARLQDRSLWLKPESEWPRIRSQVIDLVTHYLEGR